MKNLLLVISVFAAVGCQQADKLTYTEKRTLGSWFYTDVDFIPRWSLNKDDITSDYFGDIITFKNDFTTTYEDNDQNVVLSGVWQINLPNANTGNSSAGYDQLVASYENPMTGEITQMIWDNFSVNKKRIWADNSDKDGFYHFELKKF